MANHTEPLAHHFADLEQQHEANSLGMWIFLATELMFFGGMFAAYTLYRHLYPQEFAAASNHLNLVFGSVNTVVLLTSSLTMAFAVHAARHDQRTWLLRYLALTALLGTLFLVIKGFEYRADYVEGLVPGLRFHDEEWERPGGVKLFLLIYFTMTGVHAVHLIIGIGLVAVIAFRAWQGRYSPRYFTPVDVTGLYWHFVDVIWIFLLPLLYMAGVRS
jgi:cytochrome c oxidase subunit 3